MNIYRALARRATFGPGRCTTCRRMAEARHLSIADVGDGGTPVVATP